MILVALLKLLLFSVVLLLAGVVLVPLQTGQLLDELLNVLSDSPSYTATVSTRNGVLTPVGHEIVDPLELTLIQGAPPPDLDGVYLRVGPNELTGQQHGRMAYHLFDGHGMVHAVRWKSQDGTATYTRSWLHTPRLLLEQHHRRDVLGRIGNLYLPWLPWRLLAQAVKQTAHKIPPLQRSTANTNIMLWGTRLYALNEGSLPFEFTVDPNTGAIQSIGFQTFDGRLDQPVTAHPRRDPATNNIVFASYNAGTYRFPVGEVRVSDHQLLSLTNIPGRTHGNTSAIGWAHDAALTPHYVIIPDGGSTFSIHNVQQGVFIDLASTLGFTVVPRHPSNHNHNNATTQNPFSVVSDDVASIVHIATAWETPDHIVVAAPVSSDLKGIPVHSDALQYNRFQFAKWTLPKQEGPMHRIEYIPDDRCSPEFPRVHPEWDATGHAVTFAFASCITPPQDPARVGPVHFNAWAKFDLASMQLVDYIPVPHPWVLGELAPVPKAPHSDGASRSDAVWLMGVLVHVETLESRLVVYDGQAPQQEPVATWAVPHGERIPAGFHSQWYHSWQLWNQKEETTKEAPVVEEQNAVVEGDMDGNDGGPTDHVQEEL